MNGEIGYIVAVQGMREYLLRRDEEEGASPDVGSLVKIGKGSRPIVAVVSGIARAIHEELQPYIPATYQGKYLPSHEDFRDSYLTLLAVGELPDVGISDGGAGGGGTGDVGAGSVGDGTDTFHVTRVPDLSDTVSLLSEDEVRRFHTHSGAFSLGYLQDLTRTVEPEALLRLLDLVERSAGQGAFATDTTLGVKFKAVRRHIRKGASR